MGNVNHWASPNYGQSELLCISKWWEICMGNLNHWESPIDGRYVMGNVNCCGHLQMIGDIWEISIAGLLQKLRDVYGQSQLLGISQMVGDLYVSIAEHLISK